ncbi:MAG: ABC transporter permease [Clostridia bacterium]|nr:ABC transporter permease [Clostridia bacterium]
MSNNAETKKVKEPLIRIAARDPLPFWKSWGIRIIAFLLAFVVYVLVVYAFTELTPVETFKYIFKGAFGTTPKRLFGEITLWKTIRDIMLLFGVALALTPAFKMRYWNIGGEGQILIGGLMSIIIMRCVSPYIQDPWLIVVMAVCSALAGAIWSAIPGIFKATHNTNETLFTLMMNYIAIQLVAFINIVWEKKKGSGTLGMINADTQQGWLPQEFMSKIVGDDGYAFIVLFVVLIAVFMFFYMKRSKHGYEISVVGDSHNTARYAGISVKQVIIRTAAISGAICGFIGFLIVSGSSHTVSVDTANSRGFTAIIVAWLGKLNVFYMLLVSAMLVILNNGASELASKAGLNISLSDVLTGVVLFFILASELFVNYKLIFRHSKREEA